MRTITLGDFLTDKQIKVCWQLKNAQDIHDKVIKPNIDTINRKLGQENDPMYLAYLCEFVVIKASQEIA